ncbi:MAG: 7-cyano-7-deazaguanine synthase [Pirellulales bacterium]
MKKPSRTIGLKISVFDAEFWNSTEVRDSIHDAVDFVSGDFWDVEFVPDTTPFYRCGRLLSDPYEGQLPLICLYSGGLDSVAGLAARIAANPDRPMIPVTVWHQPRQRHLVRKQLKLFGTEVNAVTDPLIVKVAILWSAELDRSLEERSQRCRSFLFATLGAIAAIMHGQQVVEVFESGIGAINLPLMAGMIGAKTTKSAHPKFLRLMSRLATLIARSDVEFCLPFHSQTKGELVRSLCGKGLQQLANLSASCVHFPQRHCKQKQCGVCPACIFRRQALATAGITESDCAYEYDFLGSPRAANKIPPKRIQFLKAFLMQVAWLKDVETRGQLPPAFARHLISTEILGRDQSQEDVVELLTRYRDEWMAIASERESMGHHWARLLAVHEPKTEGATRVSA